jgi:predicted RecA/RadA family phage recombinase
MPDPVAIYRQYGNQIAYTPVADVAAGDVVDLGTFVGIAQRAIPADELGALAIEGVFEVNKFTDEAIDLGAPVYWDVGTTTATGTIGYSEAVMGLCVKAALAGDSTVLVKLTP